MDNRQNSNWFKNNIIIRNIFIFTIPLLIATLIIIILNLSQSVEHLTSSLIKRTTDKTHNELKDFFEPVKKNLFIARDWGLAKKYGNLSPKNLNERFIPILKFHNQISSMMITDENGNVYMLLQEDSTWTNREIIYENNKKTYIRYRWGFDIENNFVLIKKWEEEGDYNPLKRPWFIQAIKNNNPLNPSWTNPYIFYTNKEPGITVSTKWHDNTRNLSYVVGLDVLLTDISKFTAELKVSKNGTAFIISEDEKIIGLPRDKKFENIDSLKKYVLKDSKALNIEEITQSIAEWNIRNRATNEPFIFSCKGQDWWAGFDSFMLNETNKFYIAVIVPEDDFMAEMNRTKLVITGGLILVISLSLLVIRAYSQKRKAYILLEKKNEQIKCQKALIEKKNKSITDSINYAQKIQHTILPSDDFRKNLLPDSYILFLPKDIVSGDFYFLEKHEGKIIASAIDCTGHGVPGAFVSMLAANLLSRAVNEKDLTKPSDILDFLSDRVQHNLRKEEKLANVKDGMDLALCTLDLNNMKGEFAGAYNPLYIVRNKEVIQFKADKYPIGEPFTSKFEGYTNHEFELLKDDILVMFSDGFQDQFGGPKRKKFLTKRLREKLIEISALPLNKQKENLHQTFIDWKKDLDQIDDVVIFSIKI